LHNKEAAAEQRRSALGQISARKFPLAIFQGYQWKKILVVNQLEEQVLVHSLHCLLLLAQY
jgi:hypothetical protein